ncbi:hypothetical protein BU23DRAFT_599984 [Bimuria novae-zelandiae CBS 107.79]|uniref:Ubiquitin interaction motif protein n=1 Tax=Bimuria novae-zelandiae CBS 107.79 TaxID=1447943 RepID=A0A6A5V6S4_9PLEO|nr:hypothetical protein BU23DRAFT_599984 [Bimuria novae-zelandiae CBS 107.79]
MASEESIDTLCMLTDYQIDRDQAAQILKISGNDVLKASNKFFDAQTLPNGIANLLKQGDNGWDDNLMGTAGYGPHYEGSNLNSNVPSFRIDHDVDYARSTGPNSAAPTRPPSRTSQRPGSALSTHMGDVPMQSVETGQESGVVGSSGTPGVLRPATQSYYDSASWALVPATKSTEYIPDASVNAQIRGNNPGFIKPTVGDHHLPALITILHSIPVMRNALLAPEIAASDYWCGEEWWKGTASAASITVADDPEFEATSELELLYEVQRLIAFLDASERSYASLESLLQLDAWNQASFDSPDERIRDITNDALKFLLRWGHMYQKHAPTAQLDGVFRSTINVNGEKDESAMFEVSMDSVPSHLAGPTLYDAVDATIFGDAGNAHILNLSNILVLTLNPGGPKRICKIPHVLYADRYLEENRAMAEANFSDKNKYHQRLAELDAEVDKLKYHTPQKIQYPHKMETLKLLRASMGAFDSDTGAMTENRKDVTILNELQSIYNSVERKLNALEDEKKKAKEALDEISERFRAPMEEPDSDETASEDLSQHKFTRPYKLRGVAKSKTEYYICRPIKDSGPFEKDEAWWSIKYKLQADTNELADIDYAQKDIKEILNEISELTDPAILVYANETAFTPDPVPLSEKLDAFIKKDNANFQQKVKEDRAAAPAGWGDEYAAHGYDQDDGNQVNGNWFEGDNGWGSSNGANAEEYYQQGGFASSKTLTPDTDIEPPPYQDEVPDEVVEIHLDEFKGEKGEDGRESRAKNRAEDVEMADAEASAGQTEHIEVVGEERKGG